MRRLRLGSLVWLGSILAGLGLGAYVLAAWPEPELRLIRLPYGESMPKTPRAEVKRAALVERVTSAAAAVKRQRPQLAADEPATRELAGPPPVASKLEVGSYRQETAEELGAKPLPGMYPEALKPLQLSATEAPAKVAVATTP